MELDYFSPYLLTYKFYTFKIKGTVNKLYQWVEGNNFKSFQYCSPWMSQEVQIEVDKYK